MQALIRELKEELGADVKENEVTFYTELIYTYFGMISRAQLPDVMKTNQNIMIIVKQF